MRLFFKVFLAVMALSLMTGSICYAIYSKSVSSHVKVIAVYQPPPPPPPTVALEFYKDSACTQVCGFVEWGEVERGKTVTRTEMFWVKNIGDVAVTISGGSTLPPATGTFTIQFKKGPTWSDSIPLAISEVCEAKGILAIDSFATLGDVSFAIMVSVG